MKEEQRLVVPADIDRYIASGIEQAKQKRKAMRKAWARRGAALIACVLCLGVFVSIRLSPAVAAYVSHIPGLEKLVELIRDDKGLQMAAEHNMVQKIGTSAEHEGVSFTVDQVLMDQRRMVIFYTIRHSDKNHEVDLEDIKLLDPAHPDWEYGASWSVGTQHSSEIKNRVDVFLASTNQIPDLLTAKAKLSVDSVALDVPFEVTFPIDKSKYANLKENVYEVNKAVTVDNQRFTVERITVYPTQTEVNIKFDPANTKHIFDFDQLRLVDEKGQTFAFWGNGVPSQQNKDGSVTYNLESTYFEQPEKLFLKANSIRALDKDKLEVVIDAKQRKLVKVPDSRLQLTSLRQNGDVVGIDFSLEVEEQDEHHYISLMSELRDNLGNEYESRSSSSMGPREPNIQDHSILYKRTTSKGTPSTYSFTLDNYPTRLKGDFSIQVK